MAVPKTMAVTKTMLKSVLRSKLCTNGRMTVPNHKIQNPFFTLNIKTAMQRELLSKSGVFVRPMLSTEKVQVKKFMFDHFYEEALVPKSLKLKETYPTFQYLEDELNLMLDSPTNLVSIDLVSKKLIGAFINTIWSVDKNFDAFEVDGIEYLNVAAEIAHEETNDPLMRIVIWRDYHFQLIYHLLQAHARKKGSKFILYGGMAYVLPEYRGLGISPVLWSAGQQWAMFSTLGTYPGFSSQLHQTNPGKFSSLGYIPFSSLNFNPYSLTEKSVFQGMKSGMNLVVSI